MRTIIDEQILPIITTIDHMIDPATTLDSKLRAIALSQFMNQHDAYFLWFYEMIPFWASNLVMVMKFI